MLLDVCALRRTDPGQEGMEARKQLGRNMAAE